MDKVISTRVDESVAFEIENLSKSLRIPKKKVIENAIRAYAEQAGPKKGKDFLDRSWGAWNREESPAETVKKAREAFDASMRRHQP
ncbi:MAG: hypothetical protein KC931_15820 [Candidatus Omnitrophica bacterium]|nr:hypothetical protein [Candidatus Omnitrophota bacterium]MCA9426982.1 hypothetical protein [Candidatus Omnitrophota bacterium]MCA9431563.1 hypothetical protein [Candidatus Omnitrophota bacterium]MCA9437349.1 hypothetical protein [Candidatus Omnitrophota bacterium]MCA9448591.1 hypothetical protein [Candidatus Omnitrophota bacterium]